MNPPEFAQYHNPTPQEAMTYALARAEEYARLGDATLSRAMLACYHFNRTRLALAVTRAIPVSIPLDSGDRRGL